VGQARIWFAAIALALAPATAAAQAEAGGHTHAGAKRRTPALTGRAADVSPATVVVAPEVLEGWRFLYRFITEVEFVLCLEGRREGSTLYIDGFRLARMEDATLNSVRYQPCTGDRYVGTAHNHPPVEGAGSLCYRSMPDRQSFEADPRALVDVVLCGDDRFLWTLKDGTTGGTGLPEPPR